ncbi:MAG: DUF2892 domain-containing protein [Bdellovibrionales bacterium]|nr:DUF2892 domain-containing protein [Bdellovibrionales bacterium]
MKVNSNKIERVLRMLVGLGVLSLAFIGPKSPLGYLGIIPLVTGLSGYCPLYTLFGISTCSSKPQGGAGSQGPKE